MAVSTSPLRSANGTTTASTARSVPCPWWGVASSLNVTTSYAQSVAKISNDDGYVRLDGHVTAKE